MVDSDGFRPNVGIILSNAYGQLLWAKRIGQNAWQFPQGGINGDESPEEAMYRELHEEIGLLPDAVTIIDQTRGWLRYRLPKRYIRRNAQPLCIGQKQKWFLLQLTGEEQHIRFDCGHKAEFDDWRWVSYWYPVTQVIDFKKDVYRRALKELSSLHAQIEHRILRTG